MLPKTVNAFKPSEEIRDLRFLEELGKNPIVSQRELSQKFGIALGLANACLQRMVQRGWIEVRPLHRRKVGYFLTRKGIQEKTRLSLTWISNNVKQYSELKRIILEKFLEMEERGKRRIVFYGVSDEMEVAYITLQGLPLKLVGIVEDDEKFRPEIILGYELEPVNRIQGLKPDAILITSIEDREKRKEKLLQLLDTKRIHISDICI